jgi:hypothetical protein
MPDLLINTAGELGIIRDVQPHELPLNAWSDGGNVRFKDGFAEKFLGHTPPFTTPTIAPYNVLAVPKGTYYWLLMGLTKVHAWDGAAYSDITRLAGDYMAQEDLNWTPTILNGIPVLNNGIDDPQMWNPPDVGTKLIALSNWPANTKAAAIRAFKNYLVALDVTKASTRYHDMVKWSHPASPGAVPISWDETDPTRDAGESVLSDTPGEVIDCLPLRDSNFIYKSDSTWAMQFIGGIEVFKFSKVFLTIGALTRRCAVEFFSGKHFLAGFDDIVLHNGQEAESIVDRRMKRWLFSNLDPLYYVRSFVVHNQARFEVWFCFPQTGSTLPNTALVWNYKENTIGIRDLPNIADASEGGIVSVVSGDDWDDDAESWDSDASVWGDDSYTTSRKRLLLAQPAGPQVYLADNSNQFDEVNVNPFLERLSMPVPIDDKNGPNYTAVKTVTEIWARIEGSPGGVVNVYIGTQMERSDPVSWSEALPFVIGTTKKLDKIATGRLFSIRFDSDTNIDWRLHGYTLSGYPNGRY